MKRLLVILVAVLVVAYVLGMAFWLWRVTENKGSRDNKDDDRPTLVTIPENTVYKVPFSFDSKWYECDITHSPTKIKVVKCVEDT